MRHKGLLMLGFATALCLSILTSFSALAGEWKQDENGWWYQEDDGSYPVSTWKEIDGTNYYFDANGYQTSEGTSTHSVSFESNNPVAKAIAEDMGLTYGEIKAKYGEYELGNEHKDQWYYYLGNYINDFVYDSTKEDPVLETNFGVSDPEEIEKLTELFYGKGLPKGKEVFFTNSPVKVLTDENSVEKHNKVDFAPNYSFLVDDNGNIPDSNKVLRIQTQIGVLFPELPDDFEMDQFRSSIEAAGGTDIDIQDRYDQYINPWENNQLQGVRLTSVKFRLNGYLCSNSPISPLSRKSTDILYIYSDK